MRIADACLSSLRWGEYCRLHLAHALIAADMLPAHSFGLFD